MSSNGINQTDVAKLIVKGEALNTNDLNNVKTFTQIKSLDLSGASFQDNKIPSSAFASMNSLTEVLLPDTVVEIGSSVFQNCTSLKSISLPSGLTTMGSSVFQGCTSLESVDMSKTQLLEFGPAVFQNCTNLASVALPDTLTKISIQAFSNCTSLASITIPQTVTSIDSGAFSGCTKLTSITLPLGIETIESGVFSNCTGLTSISVPPGIKTIKAGAFSGCLNLKHVYFSSETPPTVSYGAFPNDTIVHIPAGSSDNYPRDNSFPPNRWNGWYVADPDQAPSLQGQGAYRISQNEAFIMFTTDLYYGARYYYAVVEKGADIPTIDTTGIGIGTADYIISLSLADLSGNGAKDIYIVAMMDNNKSEVLKMEIAAYILDVVIDNHEAGSLQQEIDTYLDNMGCPNDYSSIKRLTISGEALNKADQDYLSSRLGYMYSIETIDLSDTTLDYDENNEMKAGLFKNRSIKSVLLPKGLSSISEEAFYGCEYMYDIIIPDSVQSIGDRAFMGCESLSDVILLSDVPHLVGNSAFSSTSNNAVVLVPQGSVSAYLAVSDGNTQDNKWYGLTVTGSGDEKNIIHVPSIFRNVPWDTDAEAIGLPDYVPALLNDSTMADITVEWNYDTYNVTIPGNYTIIGALKDLPDGVSNTLDRKARAVVSVSESGPTSNPSGIIYDLSKSGDIVVEFDKGYYDPPHSVRCVSKNGEEEIAFSLNGNMLTIARDTIMALSPNAGDYFTFDINYSFGANVKHSMLTVLFMSSGGGENPGGGSTPGNTVPPATTPAAGNNEVVETGESVTVVTKVTPTVQNEKATVAVPQQQLMEAINTATEEAGESGGARITIQVEAPSGIPAVEIGLPKDSVKAAEQSGIEALTISNPVAELTFDKDAIAAIAGEEAKQAVGDRPVFEFSVTSGDKVISQFGGYVTVSVPYTPKAGEDTNAIVIYFINAEGKLETVANCAYDPVTGTVRFTTNHFSQYAVGYNKIAFSDVSETAWYENAVSFIAARGITLGTGGDRFSPDAMLTRGQFMVMLMRAYGIAPDGDTVDNFADAGNTFYTGYLAAAKRLGISNGIGGNRFGPEQEISRQEMFTLLYSTLRLLDRLPKGSSGKTLSDFSDAADIASWASDAMTYLVEAGIVSGNGEKLLPKDITTRAQMAAVLFGLLSK